MAFYLSSSTSKSGICTFRIIEANRIPKTNKIKNRSVESMKIEDAIKHGYSSLEEYAEYRLEEIKTEAKEEEKKAIIKINFDKLALDVTDEDIENDEIEKRVDRKLNVGHAAYSKMYHSLELDELINNRRRYKKVEYNANVVLQHMLYSRLLWPSSKIDAWRKRTRFYGDTNYSKDAVYNCMDLLLEWRDDILVHLDNQIKKKYGRKNIITFYDVTNYYIEKDEEDDEVVELENGLKLPGLRARGVSKEHRPEPIIQMGLFMDEHGLPISYELYRGNTNDCITFGKSLDRTVLDLKNINSIFVADKGMMTYSNIVMLRKNKSGYVISQSLRTKSGISLRGFALDNEGWTEMKDPETGEVCFKIKERIVPRDISTYEGYQFRQATLSAEDKNRVEGSYNERQIFIWSKKYSDRTKNERARVLEKAKQYAGTKSNNFKESSYGKLKYTKKIAKDNSGNKLDTESFEVVLDEEKITNDEKFDGFYVICTNVVGTDNPDKDKDPNFAYYDDDGFLVLNKPVTTDDIIDMYGGLWKIEETFKITKTGMMNTRPIRHYTQPRIRSHFLICFIGLVIERLIEFQMDWKYSASAIQKALSEFDYVHLEDSNIYCNSCISLTAMRIFKEVGLPYKLPLNIKQSDIRSLFAMTKKKDYE